ncbi:MAG: hypothetical protein ACKV19_07515 [Verrucomicrobiales bacterium]
MKHMIDERDFRWLVRAVVSAAAGLAMVSCAVPPREMWARVKDEGVLKALFVPKRSVLPRDTTQQLAGADLSVESEGRKPEQSIPVAVEAEHRGYVYSPHTPSRKLVNVTDFKPGETALCPYSMEPFVVPGRPTTSAPESWVAVHRPQKSLRETKSFGPPTPAPTDSIRDSVVERSVDPTEPLINPAVQELTPSPAVSTAPDAALVTADPSSPFGTWVDGKPGHVYSPFAERHQLVDVTSLPPGTEVHCPFSGKIFRVPESGDPMVALDVNLPDPAFPADAPPLLSGAAPDATESPVPDLLGDANTTAKPSPSVPGPPSPSKYGASTPAAGPAPTVSPTPSTAASTSVGPAAPKPTSDLKIKTPATRPPEVPSKPKTPKEPEMPTASWVPNKPGLVQSPFGKPGDLVDVTGKPTGSRVVCPYTNKPFRVPPP